MTLLDEHAREKAGMPAAWRPYSWECFPKSGDRCLYVQVKGAVCTAKFSRGKRKGQTNWSKLDPSTERTVILPTDEHEAWQKEWSKRTGKCIACEGTGQVFAGCSVTEGVRYRPCRHCGATGKATL